MTVTRYHQQDRQDQKTLHFWIVDSKRPLTDVFSSVFETLEDDLVLPIVVMEVVVDTIISIAICLLLKYQ